ncbi:MAG TPA: MBL fold metallo-hydrolase [Methylomirabilota bacterium]|nr:MBL fold metallo-hydrolase [Methylomirabilota bacterium]
MPWIDPNFPKSATPADWVGRVLGLNPGMMTGPGTNTYLVGDRAPILIDTGAGVPGWMPLLETYMAERGWRAPARVLITHRHKDHLGGVKDLLQQYPGTPVSKMIHKDTDLPAGISDLRDGQAVKGDGVTLVPVHTPGHASDHLCYFVPETKSLFTGDLVLGGSTTVIPDEDGDLTQYMDSLRRILRLDVATIYPAHGPVIENAKALIKEYIAHRLEREKQILAAVGDGKKTIPEMVKVIYVGVPEALHGYAGQSVHSHLKKLKAEKRVQEETVSGQPSRWTLT